MKRLKKFNEAKDVSGTLATNRFGLPKEFTDFDFIKNYDNLDKLVSLYKLHLKPEGKIYLFIDEVQDIEGWERLVNSYSQSYIDNYEIFITGSNSQLLSGELASLLSGRYIQFQIMPFSYSEFLGVLNIARSKESFLQYMQTGGLPELYNLPNDETKRYYLSAIKDTVLLRDIIQRYQIKDARLLEDIFVFLINNASNLISISNIINYFKTKNRKTNYETISNYISYLKNTFLLHQVDRYNIKGKETISGTNKFYANDLSYKNYLYPGFEYGFGYLLENLVYLQLINVGFTVYTGVLRNREIDFVALKGDRTIYFQVTYMLVDKSTIERGYSELESINDNYEKYVVSLDDLQLTNRNGIKHVLAWELDGIL